MAKDKQQELWDNLGNKNFVEKFVKEAKDITPKDPRVTRFAYSKRDFKDFMNEILNQISLFRSIASRHRESMVANVAKDSIEGYAKAAGDKKAAEAYGFMSDSLNQIIVNRFEVEIELIDDTR